MRQAIKKSVNVLIIDKEQWQEIKEAACVLNGGEKPSFPRMAEIADIPHQTLNGYELQVLRGKSSIQPNAVNARKLRELLRRAEVYSADTTKAKAESEKKRQTCSPLSLNSGKVVILGKGVRIPLATGGTAILIQELKQNEPTTEEDLIVAEIHEDGGSYCAVGHMRMNPEFVPA